MLYTFSDHPLRSVRVTLRSSPTHLTDPGQWIEIGRIHWILTLPMRKLHALKNSKGEAFPMERIISMP